MASRSPSWARRARSSISSGVAASVISSTLPSDGECNAYPVVTGPIATEPRPPTPLGRTLPGHVTTARPGHGRCQHGTGTVGRVRVAIIGAGPTGLYLGGALQRRGHAVTVVDRDGGPERDGSWPRKGVMQFHHAHAFRAPVAGALERELPEVWTRWLELGAEPVSAPGATEIAGIRSQRSTFERALHDVVAAEPGLVLRRGHVGAVRHVDGVAIGLEVDGEALAAELVLDASGRSSPVTRELGERDGFGGDCGIAYVDRLYRLRPGAEPGPLSGPIAWQGDFDGYQVLVFPHEAGLFSTVIMRQSHDTELKGLRHDAAHDAACAAITGLAAWT